MKLLDKFSSKKKYIILTLIFITIISCITLFLIPGMSRGHDFAFHLARIKGIVDYLNNGGTPYINSEYLNGYGYANPLFYSNLFLIIPALLTKIGIPIIYSYKIFIFLISLASIISMYISVKGITKNKKSALFSAVLYAFASYRLIDTFTRGALGETLAFVFAPLIIYGIYEIIYGNPKKFYILVIGMSGLILSHIISTYMIVIALVLIAIINYKKLLNDKKRIFYIMISAVITLLLTSYFLLPMFEQMASSKFIVSNINETSELARRSLPIWASIIELPYFMWMKPWVPSGIGIGLFIMIIMFFKNKKNTSNFTKLCFILSIVFLFISSNLFPWTLLKNIMAVIQFPWRYLFLVTIFIAIGSGLLINDTSIKISNKKAKIFMIILILPVINIVVANYQEKVINKFTDYEVSYGEYLPIEVDRDYIENRGNVITTTNPLIHTFTRNASTITIEFINNKSLNQLELPLIYYKGYSASYNNINLKTEKSNNGLVLVTIDETMKNGIIVVNYQETKIQKYSKVVSIITLISFTTYLIITKRGEKNEKER